MTFRFSPRHIRRKASGTPGLDFATLPLPQRALRRRRRAAVRPGNLGVPGCLLPFPKPGSHSSLQNCPSPVNSFLQVSHCAIVESSTRPVYATTTVQAHATRLSCEETAIGKPRPAPLPDVDRTPVQTRERPRLVAFGLRDRSPARGCLHRAWRERGISMLPILVKGRPTCQPSRR
jgi:hypothetical protein